MNEKLSNEERLEILRANADELCQQWMKKKSLAESAERRANLAKTRYFAAQETYLMECRKH